MDLDLDPQSDVQPAIDLDLDPDMQPAMDLDLDPHPGVQPGPRSPLPSPSGRPCAAPRPTGPHSAQTAGQAAREGSSRRPKQGQGQGQSQGQGQRRSASSKLGNPPSSRSQGESQACGRSPGTHTGPGGGGEQEAGVLPVLAALPARDSLMSNCVPAGRVLCFVWSVLRHILPPAALGCKRSRKALRRTCAAFLLLRRRENMTLHQAVQVRHAWGGGGGAFFYVPADRGRCRGLCVWR